MSSPGTLTSSRAIALVSPQALPAAFTGVLAEIAAVAGGEAAYRIAQAKGGRRAYIPSEPPPEHWLSQLVGHDRARAICRSLVSGKSGMDFIIPMDVAAGYGIRWRRMKALIDAGHSKREIAALCGVHERTVQRHRTGAAPRVTQRLDQRDLFDA